MYQKYFKRLFDLISSIVLSIVGAIPFVIIALLTGIFNGRPILFKQKRPGLNGRPFVLYKFRTMTNYKDRNGQLLPDEQRITRFGRFLRSSSLDELPELFNVLKGDMSLVGPRPLLMEYLPLYSAEQARRHDVKPGITGWAQINGRNALTWQKKFELDVWYVDHVSFLLDLKILFLTVFKVFRQEGITQPGKATMEKFTGN